MMQQAIRGMAGNGSDGRDRAGPRAVAAAPPLRWTEWLGVGLLLVLAAVATQLAHGAYAAEFDDHENSH